MWWWDGGPGVWGWLGMGAAMIAFWGLVAWEVVVLVRGRREDGGRRRSPEEILGERLARGEIDEEEYRGRLAALRDAAARPPVGGPTGG